MDDAGMKIGDLVRPKARNLQRDPIRYDNRKVGIIVEVNSGWDGNQVRVLWNIPTWYDTQGLSAEHASELEVISETR